MPEPGPAGDWAPHRHKFTGPASGAQRWVCYETGQGTSWKLGTRTLKQASQITAAGPLCFLPPKLLRWPFLSEASAPAQRRKRSFRATQQCSTGVQPGGGEVLLSPGHELASSKPRGKACSQRSGVNARAGTLSCKGDGVMGSYRGCRSRRGAMPAVSADGSTL